MCIYFHVNVWDCRCDCIVLKVTGSFVHVCARACVHVYVCVCVYLIYIYICTYTNIITKEVRQQEWIYSLVKKGTIISIYITVLYICKQFTRFNLICKSSSGVKICTSENYWFPWNLICEFSLLLLFFMLLFLFLLVVVLSTSSLVHCLFYIV